MVDVLLVTPLCESPKSLNHFSNLLVVPSNPIISILFRWVKLLYLFMHNRYVLPRCDQFIMHMCKNSLWFLISWFIPGQQYLSFPICFRVWFNFDPLLGLLTALPLGLAMCPTHPCMLFKGVFWILWFSTALTSFIKVPASSLYYVIETKLCVPLRYSSHFPTL